MREREKRKEEKEDLLPTRPHRISHILLIHLTPQSDSVCVSLFVASDSSELALCALLEVCVVSVI